MVQKLSTCKWLNKNYEKERYFIGVLLRKTNEQQKPSTNPIRVPPPATMKNLTWFLKWINRARKTYDAHDMYHVNLSETILDKWPIDICSIYSWWSHIKERLERIFTNNYLVMIHNLWSLELHIKKAIMQKVSHGSIRILKTWNKTTATPSFKIDSPNTLTLVSRLFSN